jgi:hypothetical protein
MISNTVIMSDNLDKIDWERSANNFGDDCSQGKVQTNYYGKAWEFLPRTLGLLEAYD